MDILKINEFYSQLVNEKEIYKSLIGKIQSISDDNHLRKVIREEIFPLAKNLGYSFTEQNLFDYEKMMSQRLSEEDLENIAGGVSFRIKLIAGSFLSLNLLSSFNQTC